MRLDKVLTLNTRLCASSNWTRTNCPRSDNNLQLISHLCSTAGEKLNPRETWNGTPFHWKGSRQILERDSLQTQRSNDLTAGGQKGSLKKTRFHNQMSLNVKEPAACSQKGNFPHGKWSVHEQTFNQCTGCNVNKPLLFETECTCKTFAFRVAQEQVQCIQEVFRPLHFFSRCYVAALC